MTLTRTVDHATFHRRLTAETANVGAFAYGQGVIDLAIRAGHALLLNNIDDARTDNRGELAMLEFNDPLNPTQVWARQIWGPSTYENNPRQRHLDILVRVCAWGISQDTVPPWDTRPTKLADLPCFYSRDGHVLTVLADSILIPAGAGAFVDGGRQTVTRLRTAFSALVAAGGQE